MADYQPPKSPTLLPPRKSVELEDPGARGLESDEEDVFSDARDDNPYRSAPSSPIPRTRVEKVDDEPSHGQVPGTAAYQLRTEDAEPDEIAVIPEVGGNSCPGRKLDEQPPSPRSPGGRPIPTMVIEKVDGTSSQDDMRQTAAHQIQLADAVPKVKLQAAPPRKASSSNTSKRDNVPIPTTIVTKANGEPSHGEVPHTDAYNKRTMDVEPDVVEEKGDVLGWPTSSLNRSPRCEYPGRRSSIERASPIAADGGFGPMEYDEDDVDEPKGVPKDEEDDGFGDDFDEFEEGGVADDDFGEFDDGFRQPEEESEPEQQSLPTPKPLLSTESPFPLIDFSTLNTLDDILAATSPHLSALFPSTNDSLPNLPSKPPPPLLTDRSLSLWTQLIAPPPLQPPNWVRSRIRRLFLVSLGVPVDLDEILPASKQKKLILPFTPSTSSLQPEQDHQTRKSPSTRPNPTNASTTSLTSNPRSNSSKPPSSQQRKRKGSPPPPELDTAELRTLCSMTETALLGLSEEELKVHVGRLKDVTRRAGEVLEYWLRRKDEVGGEREAFEGVIESLVRHARRVRVRK